MQDKKMKVDMRMLELKACLKFYGTPVRFAKIHYCTAQKIVNGSDETRQIDVLLREASAAEAECIIVRSTAPAKLHAL